MPTAGHSRRCGKANIVPPDQGRIGFDRHLVSKPLEHSDNRRAGLDFLTQRIGRINEDETIRAVWLRRSGQERLGSRGDNGRAVDFQRLEIFTQALKRSRIAFYECHRSGSARNRFDSQRPCAAIQVKHVQCRQLPGHRQPRPQPVEQRDFDPIKDRPRRQSRRRNKRPATMYPSDDAHARRVYRLGCGGGTARVGLTRARSVHRIEP